MRYRRGKGTELAARLFLDQEGLADTSRSLPRGSWLARRRAAKLCSGVTVSLEPWPALAPSTLLRHRGHIEICITPYPLYQAGFRDPAEIDDAILRTLMLRYAQVISGPVAVAVDLPPEQLLATAIAIDQAAVTATRARVAGWSFVAALVIGMFYAGYYGL
jgi:hypothetical protein